MCLRSIWMFGYTHFNLPFFSLTPTHTHRTTCFNVWHLAVHLSITPTRVYSPHSFLFFFASHWLLRRPDLVSITLCDYIVLVRSNLRPAGRIRPSIGSYPAPQKFCRLFKKSAWKKKTILELVLDTCVANFNSHKIWAEKGWTSLNS